MSKERRKFSRDFKIKVVEAYRSGLPAVELSRQFNIHPNMIYGWDRQYRQDPANAFVSSDDHGDAHLASESRIAELERMIGRMALENEFLKKALSHAKNILSKGNAGNTKP